jgi:hypothetical protein
MGGFLVGNPAIVECDVASIEAGVVAWVVAREARMHATQLLRLRQQFVQRGASLPSFAAFTIAAAHEV